MLLEAIKIGGDVLDGKYLLVEELPIPMEKKDDAMVVVIGYNVYQADLVKGKTTRLEPAEIEKILPDIPGRGATCLLVRALRGLLPPMPADMKAAVNGKIIVPPGAMMN